MIVYDLECRAGGHRFEGWFGSSDDFARQQDRGLVARPQCGSPDIVKAPMAPSVGRKGNQGGDPAPPEAATTPARAAAGPPAAATMPAEALRMMRALATMQAEALKSSRWVGKAFADDARAMHYGEREVEAIHGQASLEEAQALADEGIEVAPVLFPLVPPEKSN